MMSMMMIRLDWAYCQYFSNFLITVERTFSLQEQQSLNTAVEVCIRSAPPLSLFSSLVIQGEFFLKSALKEGRV